MKVLNGYFDRAVRPEIYLLDKSWSAFRVCGCTSLALAVLLAMSLVAYQGLSPWVMAGIDLSAVATFLGLTMLTKIITGEERIVNYYHQIAVLAITTVLLWSAGQPILPYLDATMLGVGLFIAGGRVGCLMAGCCHGRPHHWGVCYRLEHAAVGFTPYFVGVRLFPIQAVESLWVLGIVLVGSVLVLTGHPPGEALTWYVMTYAIGRFCFEFGRGDPERPYLWGFSEAQWTSVLLMSVVIGLELAGILPFRLWHAGATAGLLLVMLLVTLSRHFRATARHYVLHPRHVKEVAEAINLVSYLAGEGTAIARGNLAPAAIYLGHTSLGIQISASKIKAAAGDIDHYALSSQNGPMTVETASALSRLIRQLRRHSGSNELIQGNQAVFHLLLYPGINFSGSDHEARAEK